MPAAVATPQDDVFVAEGKDLGSAAPTEHVEAEGGLTWTEEEEKKLLRKIDLFLLPCIWIMYLLSYMDRTK